MNKLQKPGSTQSNIHIYYYVINLPIGKEEQIRTECLITGPFLFILYMENGRDPGNVKDSIKEGNLN